jgi:predicted regulator of Ras-like GTPase activity (Roadblock/LC7/MglB family)
MFEPILQGLREVDGVQGAMIVDPFAAVVAYRAHAIYDLSVLQQVARSVVSTVDSVQLIQDDWDMLTAHFGEGKLLLRNLRTPSARARRYTLTVMADATLNLAFVGVALRVAVGKLVTELESAPVSGSGVADPGPGSSVTVPLAGSGAAGWGDLPRTDIAKAGLSWSGSHASSGVASSDVAVLDAASATMLSLCTKALAASVGPIARAFVKEAVRKLCGDRPFSRADAAGLIAHLAAGITDPADRASFQRATRAL